MPNETPPSKFQTWLMAARPKTLPAAAAPVIVGWGLAFADHAFRLGPALAALAIGLLLQIGANLANDVADFHRGADTAERLGPTRVTSAGLLTPGQVSAGMWSVFALAGLLGLYLFRVAGWPVLVIGLTAILAAIAYTGGPFPYGYYGLGEIFVFVYFGLAATAGTYFVQALGVSPAVWWASVPMGLLTVAILVVNNLRDIATDASAGKRTLAVRLGPAGTRVEYFVCVLAAYLTVTLAVLLGLFPLTALLVWASIFVAWRVWRVIQTNEGRPLNAALAGTGRVELLFGILLAVGLVL
ncbi:MAG: 1,4-dihydroxy-2-naphthoate polyprenyltransferase [Chloroflexota bacterium]